MNLQLDSWRRQLARASLVFSRSRAGLCGLFVLVLALTVDQACAQDAVQFFRQNCTSCHTIGGGRLTGPDLKDVTKRQERSWLLNFIQHPTDVLNSGDPYALKLKDEARGAIMVPIVGMTPALADELLNLIDAESALEESQFKGMVVSTEPFTARDIDQGRAYVLGTASLSGGGAACISCHSVRGVGALGGGRLGPDLTLVYQRLGGDSPRKNLTAWLTSPATTTMAAMFRSQPLSTDEINGLVAFFEHSAQQGGEEDASGSLAFLLLGVIGGICVMIGLDTYWRNRLRDVRRSLVATACRALLGERAVSK